MLFPQARTQIYAHIKQTIKLQFMFYQNQYIFFVLLLQFCYYCPEYAVLYFFSFCKIYFFQDT